MRNYIGSRAVLDALGKRVCDPCQDLQSAAYSPYPVHETDHAIPYSASRITSETRDFLSKSRFDVFSICVSVQFYVYSPRVRAASAKFRTHAGNMKFDTQRKINKCMNIYV